MTAEELTGAADLLLTPATTGLVRLAFQAVLPQNVRILVASVMDQYKEVALEAVRTIIVEHGQQH
jgi:hypothetical protein